jgi:hypothetical protein
LRNIDVKFDDKEKPLMLLNSLLASYEHLVTILFLGRETLPELYNSLRPCKASSWCFIRDRECDLQFLSCNSRLVLFLFGHEGLVDDASFKTSWFSWVPILIMGFRSFDLLEM